MSKDPDESMGIVEDAVSWVKSMMSKLKGNSGGMFTVRNPHNNMTTSLFLHDPYLRNSKCAPESRAASVTLREVLQVGMN